MSRRFQGGIVAASYDGLKAPNAPTIGTASAGNQSVSLTFTAPSNVGGSNVSSYAVRVSPGGLSATGTSSPISVTGLTNDVQYTFDIAAINSYGFSPYSGTVTATPFVNYVEDVFSTYLYTGNGSTQTITNGIDLAGKGGLVWLKARTVAKTNFLVSEVNKGLYSNGTNPYDTNPSVTSFNANGFTLSSNSDINASGNGLVSWTFRKAPKFFDVVTYTGDGTNNRSIAHNLGAEPGMIVVKNVTSAQSWIVYHRSNGTGNYMILNNTGSVSTSASAFPTVSSTAFVPTGNESTFSLNASGTTYVAYLFAHDPSADGIIQCGSFTTDGSGNATVNLGWEPQFCLLKNSTGSALDWYITDNMRGWTMTGGNALSPNTSSAEFAFGDATYLWQPTSTGFRSANGMLPSNTTFVYIAIRRGPMKTPTVGTSVFAPVVQAGGTTTITTSFPVDLNINSLRSVSGNPKYVSDRLRGGTTNSYRFLDTTTTGAEVSGTGLGIGFDNNTGISVANLWSGNTPVWWNFRRAPSFFDEVCYTGTGVARTVNHNLGVAPELMIVKQRTAFGTDTNWLVYAAPIWGTGIGGFAGYDCLRLNAATAAQINNDALNSTQPTASVFSVGTRDSVNNSNGTYVAYLFASCPGVSKVGSYTGNGSSQTINCGFSSGARFFLVKRADNTGDWWVWDSARGITAPADPALALNSTAAEVTSADATDPDNSGIIVNQEATCNINVNGATYIFLAIS